MKQQKRKVSPKKTEKPKKGYLWLEGALVGAALGVGAGLLAESKLGKKIGKEAKHASADFLAYIAPQAKKMKKMGEAEYKAFISSAMERYGKDKKLSKTEAMRLAKEAQASWKHLKKNL